MQKLVYAINFKGQADETPDAEGRIRVRTEAASASITTVVNSGGLTGGFDPAAVVPVVSESVLAFTGEGTFTESGVVTFGSEAHRLRFTSVGNGWIRPSVHRPGVREGAIAWHIEGGEGQFDGAGGLITVNFAVKEDGEIDEYHLGVIYIK